MILSPLTLTLIFAFIFGMPPVWASLGKVSENDQIPLSAEEADAIIQEEAKAKADKKARRRARLLNQSKFKVTEQTEIFTGKGKLTLNRVRPPSLDPTVLQPGGTELFQSQKQLSEAEIQQNFSVDSRKEQSIFMLSAIVYDRKLTRLQWQHEGKQYVAWSNIDFNYLRGLTEIKTEKTDYLFFLSIVNEPTERLKKRTRRSKEKGANSYVEESIPKLANLKKDKPKFVVITPGRSEKRKKSANIPIDALHDYYAKNEERLKVQYQRHEALDEARQRYEDENPEESDDIFINFWPVRSSVQKEPADKI